MSGGLAVHPSSNGTTSDGRPIELPALRLMEAVGALGNAPEKTTDAKMRFVFCFKRIPRLCNNVKTPKTQEPLSTTMLAECNRYLLAALFTLLINKTPHCGPSNQSRLLTAEFVPPRTSAGTNRAAVGQLLNADLNILHRLPGEPQSRGLVLFRPCKDFCVTRSANVIC